MKASAAPFASAVAATWEAQREGAWRGSPAVEDRGGIEAAGTATGTPGDTDGAAAAGEAVIKLGHSALCLAPALLDLIGPTLPTLAQVICPACAACDAAVSPPAAADASMHQCAAVSREYGTQVALRFPLPPDAYDTPASARLAALMPAMQWHSDLGKYNDRKTFDVVVGVFLSPVPEAHDGPLWVLPGSHGTELARCQGLERVGTGGPGVHQVTSPVPILSTEPGSVIVFHKALLHAGGPNLSPNLRYACYYRLRVEAPRETDGR